MNADRHLLFGLLALQNEFIDKRQLVAAFGAWMANHSKPLDEILVQQQALKEDDRAVLSRLVDRHIAARGGDVTASLRSLSSVDSIRDELARLADGDVTASIAQLRPVERDKALPSMGQATSSGQRFEIRRPLDRGGLGIVSVALDKELNREVALKEIRDDRADDQAYRTKFIYGLGAMLYELLTCQSPAQGDSLASVIKTVLADDIKAPRLIQPLVPKPLEAIFQRLRSRNAQEIGTPRFLMFKRSNHDRESFVRGLSKLHRGTQ